MVAVIGDGTAGEADTETLPQVVGNLAVAPMREGRMQASNDLPSAGE